MNRCLACSCYDPDSESCTMPSMDKWYACPIEAEKPENQKDLEAMAEWYSQKGEQK